MPKSEPLETAVGLSMTMIENYMDEHMSAYTSFENNNVTGSSLQQSRESHYLEQSVDT